MRWILASALMASLCVVALPAQGARRAESETVTIRLISVTTQIKVLTDRAPKRQLSIGDVLLAKSILRNEIPQFGRPKGAQVGSDTATVTLVSPTQTDVRVAVTLPGGTIKTSGRTRQGGTRTIPVVGGTGTFAGARGTSEVIGVAGSRDTARNIYRLRLP